MKQNKREDEPPNHNKMRSTIHLLATSALLDVEREALEGLYSPEPYVRQESARSLGRLGGSPETVSALKEANLTEQHLPVKLEILKALRSLEGRE